MLSLFADDVDMEHLLIDSTVVRAHATGCWRAKKKGGQENQALGRSRGRFSTKVHIAVDALGNPLRLLLTGGNRHDVPQADNLIEGFEPDVLIADKGYDSDDLIEKVEANGIQAVIPPRKNRIEQREA
jgi:IS5 family transposase